MSNLIQNYSLILNELRKLSIEENFYYKTIKPKPSDLELITLNITAEYMGNSWNKHDYRDMKGYTTEDCDWVNIAGMWWKNQKEVTFSHKAYHEKIFKNTSMNKKSVSIRLIWNDVALVHFYSRVGSFTTPDRHNA